MVSSTGRGTGGRLLRVSNRRGRARRGFGGVKLRTGMVGSPVCAVGLAPTPAAPAAPAALAALVATGAFAAL